MMQRQALFFTCIALILTGQTLSASEPCFVTEELGSGSDSTSIFCNPKSGTFLRSLPFSVGLGLSVQLGIDEADCFYPACCNAFVTLSLRSIISPDTRIDSNGVTRVGDSIDATFSCKNEGLAIFDSKAYCESFEADGSGWNFVKASEDGTLCKTCSAGSFLRDGKCELCPEGSYTEEEGATECKPCSRGRYTGGKGASQCLHCPAGHTTYKYSPNTCVGPQLNIYTDSSAKNLAFSARVSYDDLGSLDDTAYWGSIGDWKLSNDKNGAFATIKEKYTTSYRSRPRVLPKKLVKAVQPIIENVYCYKDNEQYSGYVDKTASGKTCTGPHQHCTSTNRGRVCYCRNRRTLFGDWKPYCETATGTQEKCDIPKCVYQSSGSTPPLCSYERHDKVSGSQFGTVSTEFGDIATAKRICDKLGGECTGVWGKGNTWRITQTSLSDIGTGTGTYILHVKNPHCVNPYYEYYFEQRWGN